ncbi:MAG: PLP-dependent transferase [Actinomycetota bacterium]|nr:PLP-dependent transferase [Actinomycetota bacterium]
MSTSNPPAGRAQYGQSVDTFVVSAGRPERAPDAPLNTPIYPASSFIAGGPMEYARYDSPTSHALEDVIGGLEGGQATVFASGMAAANAAMDLVPMGAVIVAPSAAYTGVAVRLRELEGIGRIQLRVVEVDNTAAVVAACHGAEMLWLESPTNPMMQVADLPTCITAAHANDALVLVDNTFATPILQQPISQGADIIMHSVTKALSGHSDLLLGALVSTNAEITEGIRTRRVLLGALPSAFDCYLALRGVRTLAVRIEKAQANAQIITALLSEHAAVSKVRYPGFGTMAAIEIAQGAGAADAVCASTNLWAHATSLGGVESLLERRRRWPLESETVPPDLIRLSFGIENPDDLWRDLKQALDLVLSG